MRVIAKSSMQITPNKERMWVGLQGQVQGLPAPVGVVVRVPPPLSVLHHLISNLAGS